MFYVQVAGNLSTPISSPCLILTLVYSYGGGGGGSPQPYGTMYTPVQNGMAGCTRAPLIAGGAAGGAIKLSVTSSCVINGTLSANGFNNNSGGSGGSILITSGQLSGSGSILANGGNADVDVAGGGGGGRIAIYSSLSFSGTIAAYGGRGTLDANHGGPGTVYTEALSFTSLRINNGNATLASRGLRAYVMDSVSPITLSEVVIVGGAELEFSVSTSVAISSLSGDLSGTLVGVTGQTFTILNSSSTVTSAPAGFSLLSSSITVIGTANLPSSLAIPSPVRLDAQGTVCGISRVIILEGGAYRLGAGGRSCGAAIGTFAFDVIVRANGTLTNLTQNPALPTVSGQVCALHGSIVKNVNATKLWNEGTSGSVGFCVDYLPLTTSASSTTTTTTTTTTSTSTTSTTTSTTTTATTTSTSTTSGPAVILPGIVPQPSVNASRR